MDSDSNYLDGIRSAWLGEKFGEAFFCAMASSSNNDLMRESWRTLAQLEVVTGNRMASVLEAHGESASTDEIIEISDELLHQYTDVPLQSSMLQMKETIEKAVVRFDQLLATAPDEDVTAVQFLVDHELALLAFVERELDGEHEHALDAVNSLLESKTH
jgi:hypothetical protein